MVLRGIITSCNTAHLCATLNSMLSAIIWSLVISVVINSLFFLVAFRYRTDKLTDISYALTFVVIALFNLSRSKLDTYDLIATELVCIWAIRIGGFLLYRVLHTSKDHRFDKMRDHFLRFGRFWLIQALSVWLLMIPATLALSCPTPAWQGTTTFGVIVWLLGLMIETTADTQKYRFNRNLLHKNQWVDTGIWHYSRHPNYFGEILIWIGIYYFAYASLSPATRIVAVISPAFITFLLLFVSGVPVLESSADKRWGDDPAYRLYKKRTSALIPLPNKKI